MITRKDIGRAVTLEQTEQQYILRDVIPDWEDPSELPQDRVKRPMAFLCKPGGGIEFRVPPGKVEPL